MANIVVVGAGVSGLTSALLLSRAYPEYKVLVVAKNMPGDLQAPPEYASNWAGANFMPMADSANSRWERNTWPEFARLASQHPESGVAFRDTKVLGRRCDAASPSGKWFESLLAEEPWFGSVMPDYRRLKLGELPDGFDFGAHFKSVCINTAVYLPWLVSQCIRAGVKFRRSTITHIQDATTLHPFLDRERNGVIIINCTGLGSAKLAGVEDPSVVPARGQVMLVRNDPGHTMFATSGTDDNVQEVCYLMKRPAGGGTIIGGCYQEGNEDPNPDPALAQRIAARAIQLCPEIVSIAGAKSLDVIGHGVGFRPVRKGGVRIERERMADGRWVVHNYGHGGWGYQGSYGCAQHVVEIIHDIVKDNSKL